MGFEVQVIIRIENSKRNRSLRSEKQSAANRMNWTKTNPSKPYQSLINLTFAKSKFHALNRAKPEWNFSQIKLCFSGLKIIPSKTFYENGSTELKNSTKTKLNKEAYKSHDISRYSIFWSYVYIISWFKRIWSKRFWPSAKRMTKFFIELAECEKCQSAKSCQVPNLAKWELAKCQTIRSRWAKVAKYLTRQVLHWTTSKDLTHLVWHFLVSIPLGRFFDKDFFVKRYNTT